MEDYFMQCLNETKSNPYFHQSSFGYHYVETLLTLLYPLITFSIVNDEPIILIQGIVSTLSEYRYFMNFELLPRLTHFLDKRETNYGNLDNVLVTCYESYYNKTLEISLNRETFIPMLYSCWKRDYPEETLTLQMLEEPKGVENFWNNLRKRNHYIYDERETFKILYDHNKYLPIKDIQDYLHMIQSKKIYLVK
jgi:hypothetical protein